jgi:excisionase family DNA binding protein
VRIRFILRKRGRQAVRGGAGPVEDEDLLTVRAAADVAQRSVRTIRRAYVSGRLVAHRDGNGRGVRIRYDDLRAWLLAEGVAPRPESAPSTPVGAVTTQRHAPGRTGNLELLTITRERLGRAVRASSAVQPAAGRESRRTV